MTPFSVVYFTLLSSVAFCYYIYDDSEACLLNRIFCDEREVNQDENSVNRADRAKRI